MIRSKIDANFSIDRYCGAESQFFYWHKPVHSEGEKNEKVARQKEQDKPRIQSIHHTELAGLSGLTKYANWINEASLN